MAQTNRNSDTIANLVATPRVINKPPYAGGALRVAGGLITTEADDSSGAIGRFHRVPSNACFYQMLITAADATTAGAINVGIYQTAENGGAVVDADLFASAFDLSGGPFNNYDILIESGEMTQAERRTPLWAVLGLSSDPNIEYDVAYTISTTFNGGPTAITLLTAYWV